MTVSGLPEPCTHHAKSICHLALDMLEIAGQVKVDDKPVQVGYVVLLRSVFMMFFVYFLLLHSSSSIVFALFKRKPFLCLSTSADIPMY